jgi:hypothetical protein
MVPVTVGGPDCFMSAIMLGGAHYSARIKSGQIKSPSHAKYYEGQGIHIRVYPIMHWASMMHA